MCAAETGAAGGGAKAHSGRPRKRRDSIGRVLCRNGGLGAVAYLGSAPKRLVIGAAPGEAGTPNEAVVTLLDKANQWLERLTAEGGNALAEIARQANVGKGYVTRVVQLALLAPQLQAGLREGHADVCPAAERLLRLVPLPVAWEA